MSAKYQAPISPDRKPLHTLLPLEQPLSLYIDPCDACNFRCNFCFHHYTNSTGSIMRPELFEKIIADMQEFPDQFKMVHLNGHGEPLLNPHIVDYIKLLKEKSVSKEVSIMTNASLLSPERGKQLIDAGLDKLEISIYGLSNDEYLNFSNANISFDQLYDNIQYFYSIKGNCHLYIKIAGDYFTEEEKKRFIDKFSVISDTIHIDHAINGWPGLKIVEKKEHVYGMGNYKRICPMPFYVMMIHCNGKVSPCCSEYQQKLIMGDINKESFKEIWNGNIMQELRRNILNEKILEGSVCSYCEYPECGATVDLIPYKEKLLELY